METRPTTAVLGMGAKIFLWLAGLLGAINLIEFVFYGWAMVDLLLGAGFVLIAYGTLRNEFGRPRNAAGERIAADAGGRLASVAGIVLVVAGLVLERAA